MTPSLFPVPPLKCTRSTLAARKMMETMSMTRRLRSSRSSRSSKRGMCWARHGSAWDCRTQARQTTSRPATIGWRRCAATPPPRDRRRWPRHGSREHASVEGSAEAAEVGQRRRGKQAAGTKAKAAWDQARALAMRSLTALGVRRRRRRAAAGQERPISPMQPPPRSRCRALCAAAASPRGGVSWRRQYRSSGKRRLLLGRLTLAVGIGVSGVRTRG